MIKCGDKFCGNPVIKVAEDGEKCKSRVFRYKFGTKGRCFFQNPGEGCQECGGRIVRESACSHCASCGNSSCG